MSLRSRLPPDLRAGARASVPLLLGVTPFGVVAGVAAVDAGLSPLQAVGLSVVVFAGASQLAAVDLLADDASLAVVVLTATVVNLRMSMYSASIAPYLASFRQRWRVLCAYVLTDMAYAVAIAEFRSGRTRDRRWYYLGAGVAIWIVWQVATVGGVLVGANVPDAWGVDFAVPLVFLALLVSEVDDRPRLVAALVAGVGAVAGTTVPLNLGLVGGALAGVLAGVATEVWA
jgi:4-azaleucine resistance transporter AzlC